MPAYRPSFDYESEEFIAKCEAMAYEGFYDIEIADELNISRFEFMKAQKASEKLRHTLETARAQAAQDGSEVPSPAKFAKVWKKCNGQRTKLMKEFGIGWTRLNLWLQSNPEFRDIMAETDLAFLEQTDVAGRILALGGVVGKDTFPGWERHPDAWMIRYYMNTLGKRYGYGETPIIPGDEELDIDGEIKSGIDIDSWIKQEMTQSGGEK